MQTEEPLEKIVQRFDAWYNGEILDRPPVTVLHVERPDAPPPLVKKHASQKEASLDAEFRVRRFEHNLSRRLFIGDTFPLFNEGHGSDTAATPFGCQLEFNDTSSWAVHTIEDVREVLNIRPDYENEYWSSIRKMTDLSVQASNGRWITGYPYPAGPADDLVSLCGPETMCLATMDDPEGVRLACEHIASFFPRMFDDIYDRIAPSGLPLSFEGESALERRNASAAIACASCRGRLPASAFIPVSPWS